MRMTSSAFLTLALLAAFPLTAFADTVHMKNGSKYVGKVVREGDKAIVIETPDLGAIPLSRSDIDRIEKDEPVSDEAAKEGTDEATDQGTAEGEPRPAEGDEPGEDAGETAEDEPSTASARLNERFAARIVRTTAAKPDPKATNATKPKTSPRPGGARIAPAAGADTTAETTAEPDPEDEVTIGGVALAEMKPGSRLIVFQPPMRFGPAREVIEIGKRMVATLELAGTATAYLGVERPEGTERVPMRLADVKRHVEIKSPSSHARIIEGVSAGDWLRIVTRDGRRIEGRLRGYAGGGLEILTQGGEDETASTEPREGERPEDGGDAPAASGRAVVKVQDIVELDGFFKNKRIAGALEAVKEFEPIGIVLWPTGEEILGRYLATENGRILIDLDGDGAPDTNVRQNGPIAQILRLPARVRADATQYRGADWIKVHTSESFEDARVNRTFRGRIVGLTAHAVCLEVDGGAQVIAWDRALSVGRLNSQERNRLKRRGRSVPHADVRSDVSVVPGVPAEEAARLDEAGGISAISTGREISHVFVCAPFEGSVFGVRIGEKASQVAGDSELDFDVVVVPKRSGSTEMISDTLEGLRLVMLVDGAGKVSAVEISRR